MGLTVHLFDLERGPQHEAVHQSVVLCSLHSCLLRSCMLLLGRAGRLQFWGRLGPAIIVLNTPPDNDHILQLTFVGGLTAAGAQVTTNDTFGSFEQFPDGGPHRVFVSGGVVGPAAIPEPSSIVLAGAAALTGLGCWRRKRRAG